MDSEFFAEKGSACAVMFKNLVRVKQEFPPAHQFGMPTFAKHLGLLFKMLPAAFDPFDELRRRQRCGLPASDPPNVPNKFEALSVNILILIPNNSRW